LEERADLPPFLLLLKEWFNQFFIINQINSDGNNAFFSFKNDRCALVFFFPFPENSFSPEKINMKKHLELPEKIRALLT